MNKNKGITLVSLIITIIILLIIASISVYSGNGIIKKAKLEELKTNMLLIKAKARECAENANFKLGPKIYDAEEQQKQERISNAKKELKGTETGKINIVPNKEGNYIYYYKLTEKQLKDMGISNVKSDTEIGEYIIEYDIEKVEVEIYYTKGYEGKYSLTDIEKIKE